MSIYSNYPHFHSSTSSSIQVKKLHDTTRILIHTSDTSNRMPLKRSASSSSNNGSSGSEGDEAERASKRRAAPDYFVPAAISAAAAARNGGPPPPDPPASLIQNHLLVQEQARGHAAVQVQAAQLQLEQQARANAQHHTLAQQYRTSTSLAAALTATAAPGYGPSSTSSSSRSLADYARTLGGSFSTSTTTANNNNNNSSTSMSTTSSSSAATSAATALGSRSAQQEQVQYLLLSGCLPATAANLALAGLGQPGAGSAGASGALTAQQLLMSQGEDMLAARLAGGVGQLTNHPLHASSALVAAGLSAGVLGGHNLSSSFLGGAHPGASSASSSLSTQLRAAQLMASLQARGGGGAGGRLDQPLPQDTYQYQRYLQLQHQHQLFAAPGVSSASAGIHTLQGFATNTTERLSISATAGSGAGGGLPKADKSRRQSSEGTAAAVLAPPAPTVTTLAVAGTLPAALPPAAQGATPHYSERLHISLATDEDQNWLSEFQCFIRSEILEIFRASSEDVRVRNNSKTLKTEQVGIRCRFCAHVPPSARASRSSAFPSSIPQIYQSFTMMLRDHWPSCQAIPSPQKERFMAFKNQNNQGASDSKNYWMHAARRSGMVNTEQGIQIDDASRGAAARIAPFGTNSDTTASLLLEREDIAPLVLPDDTELLADSEYLCFLLSQVQRVRLSASERVGNRKSLRLGLPGFGCRFCCQAGRLGLSRIFPARRRTLPSKIPDLHDHLRRCTFCPEAVREKLNKLQDDRLEQQKHQGKGPKGSSSNEREFYSRIWARLGHGDRPEPADES